MPELGTKHECLECGAKFYDLGKPEVRCPRCGADQTKPKPDKKSEEEPRSAEVDLDETDLEDDADIEDDAEIEVLHDEDEDEDEEILDDEILDDD